MASADERSTPAWRRALDRALDRVTATVGVLALPLLLFQQWPLRELVQAFTRARRTSLRNACSRCK